MSATRAIFMVKKVEDYLLTGEDKRAVQISPVSE